MLKISRYEIRIQRYRKYLWVSLLDFIVRIVFRLFNNVFLEKKRCRWLWSVYRVFEWIYENRAIRSAFYFRPF